MDNVPEQGRGSLSRRQVLKGAAAGGAATWATPVVQVLGVRVADAASGAPGTPPQHAQEPTPQPEPTPTPTLGCDIASTSGAAAAVLLNGAALPTLANSASTQQRGVGGHSDGPVTLLTLSTERVTGSASSLTGVAPRSHLTATALSAWSSSEVVDGTGSLAKSNASSRVAEVVLDLSIGELIASVLSSEAEATAAESGTATDASSSIAAVTFGGVRVVLPATPGGRCTVGPGVVLTVDKRTVTRPSPHEVEVEVVALTIDVPALSGLPSQRVEIARSSAVAAWPCEGRG